MMHLYNKKFYGNKQRLFVLILVVMDDALVQQQVLGGKNPYFLS